MVAAKHHSDDESSDVSSDDQAVTSKAVMTKLVINKVATKILVQAWGDRICNALHNGAGSALLTLLPLAHIASGGITVAALAAAELYCSGR